MSGSGEDEPDSNQALSKVGGGVSVIYRKDNKEIDDNEDSDDSDNDNTRITEIENVWTRHMTFEDFKDKVRKRFKLPADKKHELTFMDGSENEIDQYGYLRPTITANIMRP